jgi:hypothetical protein
MAGYQRPKLLEEGMMAKVNICRGTVKSITETRERGDG